MVLFYPDSVRSAEHKAIDPTLANELDTAYSRQQARMWSQILLRCFLVSVLDAVIWAYVYLRVGAIEQLETAFYFSMVTFTTLGYGDVTLSPDWRRSGTADMTTPAEDAASSGI